MHNRFAVARVLACMTHYVGSQKRAVVNDFFTRHRSVLLTFSRVNINVIS